MNDGRGNLDSSAHAIATLRRDNAAMRALLERFVAADDTCPEGMAWTAEEVARVESVAADARLYLRGAAVPATAAPVESEPVFAVGDVVRVTGNTGLRHRFPMRAEVEVTAPIDSAGLVAIEMRPTGRSSDQRVHPRDLVLVRKAAAK